MQYRLYLLREPQCGSKANCAPLMHGRASPWRSRRIRFDYLEILKAVLCDIHSIHLLFSFETFLQQTSWNDNPLNSLNRLKARQKLLVQFAWC